MFQEIIGDLLFVERQLTGILIKKGNSNKNSVHSIFENFFCHKKFLDKHSCASNGLSESEPALEPMYPIKTEDSPEPMSPSETRDSADPMSISETQISSEPTSPSERRKSSKDKSVTKAKITPEKKTKTEKKSSSESKKQSKANNRRQIIVITQHNVD